MSNIISGLIAMALISVFLIFYAVKLHSIALWVIMTANLGFAIADFVQSIREDNNNRA